MEQHYIGCKQISARPEDKDGKPGYAVRYPDGYESWSPKATFEAAYLPMGGDSSRITESVVDSFIVGEEVQRMGNHTVLHTKLRNGFTLITESACVDPANYSEELGSRYAREKARKDVWRLLGFVLASARNGIA
ncbi:Gp49 family protein [Zhongshania sp.]|uniref:Gp49 family protein n=1 Tax=Zhongshania sp. TaxID=1971902 RepID=UPI0035669E63